jgi:hypothetical protein
MKKTHVFTSAALNYIPKVRMLFRSLRKHHPEWTLHLALADEMRPHLNFSDEPFDEVIPIADMGIRSWRGWAFCHTIVELATAIKPFALQKLLARPDAEKVIYLDPDTVVFSRLDDILAALDEANIVLTPHQTKPETTLAAIIDNEICSLKHGVYNLGFVAVASTDVGQEFAEWWAKRVYHFCRADIPNGLFTDQRWIDLVPAFFEGVAIMRSGRHNVATWNLTTREFFQDSSGNFLVDGDPLGFYHFTGFDSGAHRVMAAKNASGNKAVQKIIDWYSNQTKLLVDDPLSNEPWAFSTYADGTPITRAQRLIYRERVDLQRAFPEPFNPLGYLAWWNSQCRLENPDLFHPDTEAAALSKLIPGVTAGYVGAEPITIFTSIGTNIRGVLAQPITRSQLSKRAWEILRTEGLAGIKKRIVGR